MATDQASTQTRAIESHYVVFQLGVNEFALPLAMIERALRMAAITPLPEAPPWLDGIINLAGKTLPVVDLGVRLGEPKKPPSIDDRLLVLADFILHVDEVHDVLEVSTQQIDPISDELKDNLPIEAVIRVGERMILLLDADQLVSYSGQFAVDWSSPEFLAALEGSPSDDFTQIKGIGPTYAQRLIESGLNTFADLAQLNESELKKALGEIKGRSPDLHSWLIQAKELNLR